MRWRRIVVGTAVLDKLAIGSDASSVNIASPQMKKRRTKTARRLEDFPLEEQDILEAVMRSTGKRLDELDVPLILRQARAIHQK
jgi:hypothetical protein